MKASQTALAVVFSLATTLSAQLVPNPPPPDAPTPAMQPSMLSLIRAAHSNMLAKTGGLLQWSPTGQVVLFLNTQKRVPALALQKTPDQIQNSLGMPCVSVNQPTEQPVADAIKALADPGIASVIVILDTPGYPSLLIAPENRWALVNVAALESADMLPDLLAERVQKETLKAFRYLASKPPDPFGHSLKQPVQQDEGRTLAQKPSFQPSLLITYRKAVQEGWAPAPTNDIQRAIWQELGKTPPK